MQQQNSQNQDQGDGDRQNGVSLDLLRIGGGNQRGAHSRDFNTRNLSLNGRCLLFQKLGQEAIVVTLIGAKRAVKGDDPVLPVGSEQIAIQDLKCIIELQGVKTWEHRGEKL